MGGQADLHMTGSSWAVVSSGWADLKPRLISALVLLVVASLAIGAGGWLFGILMSVVMAGMTSEGAGLAGAWKARDWRAYAGVACACAAGICATIGRWDVVSALAFSSFLFGPALWMTNVCVVLAGASLIWLRLDTGWGVWAVVFLIAVVVSSDSCAYVTGRLIGGPKLAPAISPGKTRSGAVGGLVGAVLAGLCVAALTGTLKNSVLPVVVWSGIIGIAAQIGDLAESAVKRRCGVKDSGRILPGHGGLLDRFDAMMAAAPLAMLLALAAGHDVAFWTVTGHDLWLSLLHFCGFSSTSSGLS